MESFGAILRTTRESKGIDISKAERETSISKEYIVALETENVSIFPGEPYLIGFLRNYSDYLGLDSKHLISLYKGKMIQEAPIPEGLLKSEPPRFLKPLIISLASAVVVVAIVLVCVFAFKKEPESENVILTEGLVLQEKKLWESFIGRSMISGGNDAELYFEENDIDRFLERMENSEYPIEYLNKCITHDWGQRVIRIYDPDGHIIEIGESMEYVARRFLKQGMTAEQVAAKTQLPLSQIEEM